jgi:uncharacterized NAD(P)/FAD-binding protein YdhS
MRISFATWEHRSYTQAIMKALHGRLLALVEKLDATGSAPTLVDLAEAMNSAQLSAADVADFVQANPRNYNRVTVVTKEHYELLVMTWMPGQSSVPHDHAGSVCVMQVVQGEAVEASYGIAADGYVDLEYETPVASGEITAGQDAGVHTVRNSSTRGEVLVTVHVYSPPLTDFRRFVPRREPPRKAGRTGNDVPTVVIIGGGFSGSVTAAQILHRAGITESHVRVVLVERRGNLGEGLAYSTRDLAHLLNVPAGRMSIWPDRPNDFVRWASERYGAIEASQFLPRQWYGEYVRESLLATAEEAGQTAELSVLLDEVRRVARHPNGGWMVHLERGASVRADAVVLAVGHRAPLDPIGNKWSGSRARFIADPWRPFATNLVNPSDSVAILGSGLTAVDILLSLNQHPRSAPITLISRHGFLPQSHAAGHLTPANLDAEIAELLSAPGGVRALSALRTVRRFVDEAGEADQDWRSVLDGLRPHTAKLWGAMPIREQRRFLSRLRPFWEVHRHRMAVAVADRFRAMLERGDVRVVAGRVSEAQAGENQVRLVVTPRGDKEPLEISADWVINCTGPTPCNSAAANPAIGSLLVHGWLQPDELGLGVETCGDGNAVIADGDVVADLFVVGTLRKPAFWESTAVPELRNQAAAVADRIVSALRSRLQWNRTSVKADAVSGAFI